MFATAAARPITAKYLVEVMKGGRSGLPANRALIASQR